MRCNQLVSLLPEEEALDQTTGRVAELLHGDFGVMADTLLSCRESRHVERDQV